MNIETIKENVNTSKYIGHEKKKINVEGDVNVPDIKPDILSIINVTADAFITKKEVVDNKVKVDGVVETYIIYLADDDNGSLRSITNTFNFTEYIDLFGITDDSFAKLKCTLGPLECKVVNGRKVSVKCPVNLEVEAAQQCKYEIGKDIVDDRNIEVKKENVSFKTLYNCKCEDTSLNETINLSDDDKPIGEILQANMRIIGKDYKTSYNKILAKAEAVISMVYIADDNTNSVETFEAKVPVMGFIDVDGLTDDMEISLDYCIKVFNIKPVYQDLKACAISVTGDIEICAYIYNKVNFDVISDLYSTEKKINCEYDTINVLQSNINSNNIIEMTQSLLIPELDSLKILNIIANPVLSEINVLDGKLALEGNIEFNILFYRIDKKILENKKMELPFQQVVKILELQSNMNLQIETYIENIENRAIGGNQLQIRLEMNVNTMSKEEMKINSIKTIEVTNEPLANTPSVVVYYVKPGDTLWNIAKKFNTTVENIKEINELTDDTIYPNEQIIIQKRRTLKNEEILM